jgi:DNA-directed RNA polymerase specialized sigma24 family protein
MSASNEPLERSDLDDRLRQLALEAQGQLSKSRERQRTLAVFLRTIQKSGKLTRPQRGQFQGLYQEIYAEALQRLFSYICEHIEDYNPERGEVLQWVNFLLSRRFFIEASREVMPTVYKGMDPKSIKRMTLEDLDRSNPSEVNPQLTPSISQEVEQLLAEDPKNVFSKTWIHNHPEASFQVVAMKRLAGFSWQEISSELEISIPTLSSFYQRCLTRFTDMFREYLIE